MKSRGRQAPDDSQRWLATYGDMVTLLMAFFVMLFAISSVKEEKFNALLSGLGQFGNPGAHPIGVGAMPVPVPEEPSLIEFSLPERLPVQLPVSQQLPPIPVPVSQEPLAPPDRPVSPEPPLSHPSPTTRELQKLEQLGQQLLGAVAAAGYPGAIEIAHDDRGLAVSIETDRVLFVPGSAAMTPQGREIIAAMAPTLTGVDNDILLEGHADTTPLNRGGYTNWNLSTDRAVAVVNVLVGDHGLPPHRLTASGFGEFQPRDPGSSPEAKARNRRVEVVVLAELGALAQPSNG